MTQFEGAEEEQRHGSDEVAARAADRTFRRMLILFGALFGGLALVVGIVTRDVGLVILLVLTYGLLVSIAHFGRRLLPEDPGGR